MNESTPATAAPLARLIDELYKLPGIGPKSAQRLAYYLLRMPAAEARALASAIVEVKERVTFCSICQNVTEVDPCRICMDSERDRSMGAVRSRVLAAIALADHQQEISQSELERAFLRKVRKDRLPEPRRQFPVGRRKIDIGYPEYKLIVELDGHGTRYARRDLQKHDRRQNEVVMKLPGWTLLRFTRDDVFNDWPYVEATLREALA